MKVNWNRRDTTRAVYSLIVFLIAILFYHWLSNFRTVNAWLVELLRPLYPIIGGGAIAYLLSPILERFGTRALRYSFFTKMKKRRLRALSLTFTYLLAFVVLIGFLLIVLPRAATSAAQMAMQLKTYVAAAEEFTNQLISRIPPELITDTLAAELKDSAGDATERLIRILNTSLPALLNYVMEFGSSVLNFFVAIIASIYVLAEKEAFCAHGKKIVYALFPRSNAEELLDMVRTGDRMFGGFITGKIIDSTIIGILCFFGVSLLRMPNAVLVSFIVGVTNVIPYFGPFIGMVPSFFLIAIVDPTKGFLFLIFILVLQQIDGNIIGPKILGSSTGLSAFWVLVSILFFGGALGVIGMIIGVPLFGLIYWWIKKELARCLERRGLPTDTARYMGHSAPAPDEQREQNDR